MTLASVPDAPSPGPASDPLVTNAYQIKVKYNEVTDDGGSPILSYEL